MDSALFFFFIKDTPKDIPAGLFLTHPLNSKLYKPPPVSPAYSKGSPRRDIHTLRQKGWMGTWKFSSVGDA
jgi:hypothetical protein